MHTLSISKHFPQNIGSPTPHPNLSDPNNSLMAASRQPHSNQVSTNTGSSELGATSQAVPLKSDKSVGELVFDDDGLFKADEPKGQNNEEKSNRKCDRPKDPYTELVAKLVSTEANGKMALRNLTFGRLLLGNSNAY